MNHVAGEQTMDRLANKLGGQAILPPTFNWLPRMKRIPFLPIADPTAPPLRTIAIGAGGTLGLNLFLPFGRWWVWIAEQL